MGLLQADCVCLCQGHVLIVAPILCMVCLLKTSGSDKRLRHVTTSTAQRFALLALDVEVPGSIHGKTNLKN